MSIHQSLAEFGAEVDSRARNAWIIHNARIDNDVKLAASDGNWRKNTKNTDWMRIGFEESEHKKTQGEFGRLGAGINQASSHIAFLVDSPR